MPQCIFIISELFCYTKVTCWLKYSPLILKVLKAYCYQVGFTLSQATKALRESRGVALLYFRPLH